MLKKNRTSLKAFILVRIILLILTSYMILTIFMTQLVINPNTDQKIQLMYREADIINQKVSETLRRYESSVQVLIGQFEETSNPRDFDRIIERSIAYEPYLKNIFILNEDKMVIYEREKSQAMMGLNLEKFSESLDPYELSVTKCDDVNHIHMMMATEQRTYIVELSLEEMGLKTFGDDDLDKQIVIHNTYGDIIYQDEEILVFQKSVIAESTSRTIDNRTYTYDFVDVNSKAYVEVSRVINDYGINWNLIIRIPIEAYYSSHYTYFILLFVVFILFLLFSVFLIRGMSLKFINPISRLSQQLILDEMALLDNNDEFVIKEVDEIYTNYNKMILNLEEKDRNLKEFVYIASHDLQEPLRVITNYIRILEMEIGDSFTDEYKKFFDYVSDGARRMKKLLEELLSYSRASDKALNIEPIVLKDLLSTIRRDLVTLIEEKNAIILLEGDPTILADRYGLEMLLQNLISNSIKFNQKTPEIHILFKECVLEVRDNGIGIDAIYFNKIMKPFSRLHTNAEYKGTGIGMAIVKKVIERHGWHYEIKSELGEGTTIRVITERRKYER